MPGIKKEMLTCRSCQNQFHYNCSLVREAKFKNMSANEKALWTCGNCRGAKPKQLSIANQLTTESKTLDQIYNVVSNMQTVLESVLNQIKQVSESQQFLADQYDDYISSMKKVAVLESQMAEKDKIIDDLSARLVQNEQYSRRTHLELGNVKQEPNEDVEDFVVKLGSKIGVPMEKRDIAAAHRLRAKPGKTPSIIVEFVSRKVRDDYLNKRKLANVGEHNKIYINESLCSYYKNLLRLAKEKAKQENYKFCWFRSNKILVKKTENTTPIVITRIEDLDKVVDNA